MQRPFTDSDSDPDPENLPRVRRAAILSTTRLRRGGGVRTALRVSPPAELGPEEPMRAAIPYLLMAAGLALIILVVGSG